MRRKLGQHFLKSPAVAQAMARALELAPGDTVIEIGPGRGQLTQALAGESEEADIKIIAIEKDAALAAEVSRRFEGNSSVRIVQGDALKDLPRVVDDTQPTNYKLAGNIPYYITGRLLRAVSELDPRPGLAVLMVQREVAERMVAAPPRMNRLAASVQFWAEPNIIRYVGRKEFTPPPDVDSAVVLLKTKEGAPTGAGSVAFYETMRILFAQPRKTLLNNLKDGLARRGYPGNDPAGENKKAAEILKRCNVSPGARPQDLKLETIKAVALEVDKTLKRWG